MRVPYLARFYLYAKRHSAVDVTIRVLCLTEPDRAENPLELQEDFEEIARSDYVEIFDKTEVGVKFGGNLLLSEEQPIFLSTDLACEKEAAAAAAASGAKESKEAAEEASRQHRHHQHQVLNFRAFSENRQAFTLRRRNDKNPYPKGKVTFYTGVEKTLFEAKVDLSKFLKRT